MKQKLKEFLRRIPRPVKVCICALLAAGVAWVYYIVLGCPTLTFEQEFRRAEKAYLLGPSTIVDVLESEDYGEFDRTIVGESDYGITFFGMFLNSGISGRQDELLYDLSYVEKTGDLTLAAPPNCFGPSWDMFAGVKLPVYIFTDDPQAVRADIRVQISGVRSWTENNVKKTEAFSREFQAEAERSEQGYFRFRLQSQDENGSYALYLLSNIINNTPGGSTQGMSIPVTVRLYDAEGALILTRELTLENPANQK